MEEVMRDFFWVFLVEFYGGRFGEVQNIVWHIGVQVPYEKCAGKFGFGGRANGAKFISESFGNILSQIFDEVGEKIDRRVWQSCPIDNGDEEPTHLLRFKGGTAQLVSLETGDVIVEVVANLDPSEHWIERQRMSSS